MMSWSVLQPYIKAVAGYCTPQQPATALMFGNDWKVSLNS